MTRKRTAFSLVAGSAYDPTAAGGALAWQRPNGTALLRAGDDARALPGTHPALGGDRIAWRAGDVVTIADAGSLQTVAQHTLAGVGALALSDAALAWRTRDAAGTDRLWASVGGGAAQLVIESPAPTELGRPALAGTLLLFHSAGPGGSALHAIDLANGARTDLRSEPGAQITNPASDGSRLLYVHATGETQELRAGRLAPAHPAKDAVLLVHHSSGQRDRERESGRHRHRVGYPHHRHPPLPPRAQPGVVATLWTTALGPDTAYVTRLRAVRGRPLSGDVLSVPAPLAG